MKTILLRMTLKTYKRLRRNFKAKRKESAASYFERLSKYIEMDNINYSGIIEGDKVINGQTPSYVKDKYGAMSGK